MPDPETLHCPITDLDCQSVSDCGSQVKSAGTTDLALDYPRNLIASEFCYKKRRQILAEIIINSQRRTRNRIAAVALLSEIQERHEYSF